MLMLHVFLLFEPDIQIIRGCHSPDHRAAILRSRLASDEPLSVRLVHQSWGRVRGAHVQTADGHGRGQRRVIVGRSGDIRSRVTGALLSRASKQPNIGADDPLREALVQ